jgi:hypothetical protein
MGRKRWKKKCGGNFASLLCPCVATGNMPVRCNGRKYYQMFKLFALSFYRIAAALYFSISSVFPNFIFQRKRKYMTLA